MSNTFDAYPYWPAETLQDVKDQLRQITSLRKKDITFIDNLQNIFVNGRKVGRIPSSSADVLVQDKVGDFNVTASFAYYLIDNSGTPAWRRVAVGAF